MNVLRYAECNVDPQSQQYACECENRTQQLRTTLAGMIGGAWPKPVPCNNTMGAIAVVNESSWAGQLPDPSDPSPWATSSYRCVRSLFFLCLLLLRLLLLHGGPTHFFFLIIRT